VERSPDWWFGVSRYRQLLERNLALYVGQCGAPGNKRQTHMSQGEEPVHQQHGRGGQVSSDAHEDTNTVYRDDFVKSGHEKVPMCTEVDGGGQANGSMGRNYAPAHLTMGCTRGGGSDGAAPALSSQSRAGHALLRE